MPENPRIFTVDEANRTLPLVRRIVHDLMVEHQAWRESLARFELVSAGVGPARGSVAEADALQRQVVAHAGAIERYLAELETIGCLFKGFEAGLVDFYSLRADRLVFLCWREGEDGITYWHELEAGFAGRQPIDSHLLSGTTP
ncbi:MAG TPA: DUF2203 domain-containing protein [Gemmatimonadales bacterium]|nr:DUF2203 domain-containing protein [Gemmatimonadales bacterium]